MKFTEYEERQLESWSCSELDAMGQKNPEVVARLIVSLVKEERSTKALQAHCNTELKPFLKETTQDFVEVLFQAIEEGTYRVDIDDGNNDDEDNERGDDDRGRRVTSHSPTGSEEDERRHRGRYRRDSSDNYENAVPATTAPQVSSRPAATAPSSSAGPSYQRQGSAAPYAQPGGAFPRSANAPGRGAGQFQNKHYRPEGAQGGAYNTNAPHPHARNAAPPRGPPRANDSASYNPYASSMFPGLTAAGLGQAGMAMPGFPGGMQPYGWMPGAAPGAPVPGQDMMYGAAGMGGVAAGYGYPAAPVPVDPAVAMPGASAVLSPKKPNPQQNGTFFQGQEFPGESIGARPPPPAGPAPPRTALNAMSDTSSQLNPAAAPFVPPASQPPAPAYGTNFGGYGAPVAPQNQFNGPNAGYGNAPAYGAAIYPTGAYPPTSGVQDFNPQGRQGGHGGQGGRGQNQKVFHPPLPEDERNTLKCTKIPDYVTEQDLRDDFEEYGHIVELQLTPVPERENDTEQGENAPKKRTYLECMVQYYSAANAKKRLHSDKAVLDNRFIQTRPAFFNLIPPAEVPYPGDAVVERDAAIVAGTYISKPKPVVGQKKPYNAGAGGAVFRGGANKYMRTTGTESASAAGADSTTDGEAEGGSSSSSAVPAAAPALTQEKHQVLQSFDQLKTLRQQAEEIARKKEEILLAQVEKCRAMVDKLEQSADSEAKQATLQNLEAKMLALQTQLRTLRSDNASREAAAASASAAESSAGQYPPQAGGYPYGGRGRGRGRQSYAPAWRGGYRGGGYPAPGRGRGGRGRGAHFSNQAYTYVAGRDGAGGSAESGEGGEGGAEEGGADGYGGDDGSGGQWQYTEGGDSAEG